MTTSNADRTCNGDRGRTATEGIDPLKQCRLPACAGAAGGVKFDVIASDGRPLAQTLQTYS
jgi:hypothetical protein